MKSKLVLWVLSSVAALSAFASGDRKIADCELVGTTHLCLFQSESGSFRAVVEGESKVRYDNLELLYIGGGVIQLVNSMEDERTFLLTIDKNQSTGDGKATAELDLGSFSGRVSCQLSN